MKKDVRSLFMSVDDIMARIRSKAIIVYGLDDTSKFLFNYLLFNDIKVEGFFIPKDDDFHRGLKTDEMKYLNKPIISNLCSWDRYVLAGFFAPGHEPKIREATIINLCMISTNQIIIYSAGVNGKRFCGIAKKAGFDIIGFCDIDSFKIGNKYCGVKVMGIENLIKYSHDDIVITLPYDQETVVCDEVKKAGFKGNAYCNYYWDEDAVIVDGNSRVFFYKYAIKYISSHIVGKGYKLVLWGKKDNILFVQKKLFLLDIPVEFGITSDGLVGMFEEVEFKNFYDLFYEKKAYIYAIDDEEYLEKIAEESGMMMDRFVHGAYHCGQIRGVECLDPSFGHNQKYKEWESIVPLPHSVDGDVMRIATLGGSTSHLFEFPETSWPEHLLKLFEKDGRKVQILSGGDSQYTVVNELVKLIRDVIPLNPDVVISYSGANEGINRYNYAEKGYFCTYEQSVHYEFLKKNRGDKYNVVYGTSKLYSEPEYWYMREKMMHAICQEFGIRFLAFAQPTLYTKAEKTIKEYEIMEHICESMDQFEKSGKIVNAIGEIANEKSESWLFDFSHIFDNSDEEIYIDNCHLTTYGNRVIAENIYDILKR